MDKRISDKMIKTFIIILVLLFSVLLFRLGYMQIIEGERYSTLSTRNHQRLNPVLAPRGEIIDRNGNRMVMNKPVYTVSLVYLGEADEKVVSLLSNLLEGDVSMKGLTKAQIKNAINLKIKDHTRLYEPVKVAVDIAQETVNKIEEQRISLPGVVIDVEPVRTYPYGDLLGEVVGYVREITGQQLEKYKDQGYSLGDSYGQVGLEYTYESYLRGKNGSRQVEVDAQGNPVRNMGYNLPVSGNNLLTTIDNRVQRAAQDAVSAAIKRARNGLARVSANTPISGAAVVIDVNSGEVLAMASLPSYDLNIFSQPLQIKKYDELLKTRALRNHAIQTTYTPGSVFKMATLSSFLEGKVVTPDTMISDPGYYKYKRDWKPGGHGIINAVKALRDSCDTYFYMFGVQAGPELMSRYAFQYGLGKKTGIDLPGEEMGRIASRALKSKIWQGNDWEAQWREYDSMDMAIGQQETRLTALQLANYVAAIANGGSVYKPHIVKKIVDPDGVELKVFQPEVISRAEVSPETLAIVREGMHQVSIGQGTGASSFWGAQYQVAAKTGTAEVGDKAKNAHALFVAYAPYEKPEIAVSVIIEYGAKGSSVAGPVAREILDSYFRAKAEDAASLEHPKETVDKLNNEAQSVVGSGLKTNFPRVTGENIIKKDSSQSLSGDTTGNPNPINVENGSSGTSNSDNGGGGTERQPAVIPSASPGGSRDSEQGNRSIG